MPAFPKPPKREKKPPKRLEQKTPLKHRSEKRAKFMQEERIPLIESLVKLGVTCEVSPTLRAAGIAAASRCRGRLEGLHEIRKRTSGGSLTNPKNLVPSCNVCNGWIEDNPTEAHNRRLVARPGDEDWDELGSDAD